MEYFKGSFSEDINEAEFEKACGVGMVVTSEQVKSEVRYDCYSSFLPERCGESLKHRCNACAHIFSVFT